jgi:hypothetical protein
MSTAAARVPLRERRAARAARTRQVLAWVMLVGWAYVLVSTLVSGERDASWSRLSEQLGADQVGEVRVVGALLPADGTVSGSSVVEIHWRDGLLMRRTVVEQRIGAAGERLTEGHVVREPVADALRRLEPGLRIDYDDYRSGPTAPALGLTLHGPPAAAAFVLAVATLLLLVGGPEPQRATRWAWFWLFSAAPPLACPAYLLLGGLLKDHPEPTGRRLTGGWAFLVFLLLGGAATASQV